MSNKIFEQAIKKYHDDVVNGSFVKRLVLEPKRHGDFIVVERLSVHDSSFGLMRFNDAFDSVSRGLLYLWSPAPEEWILKGWSRKGAEMWNPKKGFDVFFGYGLMLEIYLENAKYELVYVNPKYISHVKKSVSFDGVLFPEPSGRFVDEVAVEYEFIDVVMQNGDVITLNSNLDSFVKTLPA